MTIDPRASLAALRMLYPLRERDQHARYANHVACTACGRPWLPQPRGVFAVHPGCMLSEADQAMLIDGLATKALRWGEVVARFKSLGVNENAAYRIYHAALARRERAAREAFNRTQEGHDGE